MNIPNLLTLFRMFLIPIFILIFFSNITNSFAYSIYIFFIAGFTDVLDGYIARKHNLITKWGTVLDPLADKLMLITVLACLTLKNLIPNLILIVVTIKEVAMIIAGVVLYNKNFIIPSNIFGKMSTLIFYLAILVLSFNILYGRYILYLAVISALVAFFNYLMLYIKKRDEA